MIKSFLLFAGLCGSLPLVAFAQDTDLDGIPDATDPNPTVNAVVADPDGNNNLPASLATGLTGRWDFEALTSFGGASHGFVDLAGNDHPLKHAALGLSLDSAGMISKGVRFDAASDYMSAPGSLVSGLSSFSVSMWVKLDQGSIQTKPDNIHTSLFSFNTALDTYPEFTLSLYKGVVSSPTQKISFVRYVGTTSSVAWTGELPQASWIDDGRWRHIAMVKNGNNFRLFVDGVKIKDVNYTLGAYTSTANGYLCFGKTVPVAGVNGTTLKGSMDRLRFYSRALTDTEAGAFYTQDSDYDGFYDIEEKERESAAISPYFNRGPNADSDGDGLPDQWEIDNGFDPLDANSPNGGGSQDSDGDGVSDSDEYQWGTNPHVADSDGDGVSDGIEIGQGSNPNSADDEGDAPADGVEMVDFTIGGDYTTWEMIVDPVDDNGTYPSFKVVSKGFGENPDPQARPLVKNVKYEITLKYLRTKPGEAEDWFCWQAQLDDTPNLQTFPQGANNTVGARNADATSFIFKTHWVVDNRDGLLTSHLHSKGTNVAGSLKATLYPVKFKTYPDSEPGPGKAHVRNLPHLLGYDAHYTADWKKCVAIEWNASASLDMLDYLHYTEDPDIRTLIANQIDWQIDYATSASSELEYGTEPSDNNQRNFFTKVKRKDASNVIDQLIFTIIPTSTRTKFDAWCADNNNLSWLAVLPPMFSSIEITPSLLEPDRNFPTSIWNQPETLDSFYHPGASYGMRSEVVMPDQSGHQACYNSLGQLITFGVAAGSADKIAPFSLDTPNAFEHQAVDVKPFVWAAQLDGNPTEGTWTYSNLSAPMLYQGSYLGEYLYRRPPIPNSKPMLIPGSTP